jgi:hypothetical protein
MPKRKKRKQGNREFEKRLKKALSLLASCLNLIEPADFDLWSLSSIKGTYTWLKLMGSDGLLLARRKTARSMKDKPGSEREILVGIVIQCEQSTGKTKPNPFGKASVGEVPFGVWVDVAIAPRNIQRQRLDVVQIALVVPKPTNFYQRQGFHTVETNIRNIARILPQTSACVIPQGTSAAKIARALEVAFRAVLKGKGAPHR